MLGFFIMPVLGNKQTVVSGAEKQNNKKTKNENNTISFTSRMDMDTES